jgi:hypothetical protein
MTLHEIGMKYKTDKATHHNYLGLYEEVLGELRNKEVKILEIGISSGASLKMWEEYFTNGKIFGADINTEEWRTREFSSRGIFFDTEKTTTLVVNQEKSVELLSLPDELDVIIDDGGHTMFQQQNTLKTIFHKLKHAGIYILEDLHTSNVDFYDGCNYGRTDTNNTIRLLNDLKNGEISQGSDYYLNKIEFEEILKQISSIEIIEIKRGSTTSIIKRK